MASLFQRDWIFILILAVACFFFASSDFREELDFRQYDWNLSQIQHQAGNDISIIAIDDESIENIGRWPWPRSVLAEMVQKLNSAGAKTIASTIFFSEPQTHLGQEKIDEALDVLKQSLDLTITDYNVEKAVGILESLQTTLDTDTRLGNSMQDANFITPMQFQLGEPIGNPDEDLPEFIKQHSIQSQPNPETGIQIYPSIKATPPLTIVGQAAHGIGHLNLSIDLDGRIRSELLVVDHFGNLIPSLSVATAAASLNLDASSMSFAPPKKFVLGNLEIGTDPIARMYPLFYKNDDNTSQFSVDSFYDVYVDKIPADKYKGKTVLIGSTAFGVGTSIATPISESMSPILILANITASILNQDFITIPDWADMLELGLVVFIFLYLALVLPRLSAATAGLISLIILLLLVVGAYFSMVEYQLWIRTVLPIILLITGYILLVSKRYLVTEQGKNIADKESADSNRSLGLAYQQQGQLDMALDKFRQCPLDDKILEPLYNLATDFERKRQFNKAVSIYEYMAEYKADYKDIKERIKRSKSMQDTVMFGAATPSQAATMILDDGSVEKPMLGRYEVEKEIGKGAMGVVYQGKDPKINRIVAIKTMALSQEFEDDDLEEAKAQFFREAESAGRLNHPNIVSIYDAGEEHDLAYIAMEFLKGHDLGRYTKKDSLLPVKNVVQLITLAADALGYAHEQGVVHRDIKPANIMYLPEASTIKLTDFGIARITDTSKTKTGMVKGTPSYMSPEQLSGRHVDGRSDLFSLGIMFYQMLCGELPFKGESMASLMYKITNEEHDAISERRPEIEEKMTGVTAVIDKLLEKEPDNRLQTGADISRSLKQILKNNK